MKRLIFLCLMISSLAYGQEKYPYRYAAGNGSIKFDVVGCDGPMRLEVREATDLCETDVYKNSHYWECYGKILMIADERADDIADHRMTLYANDIPDGIYRFNIRYAPQGSDVWTYAGGKSVISEIVSDSKFICINEN